MMKKLFYILFGACSLFHSCKEPYDPDIETHLKVLVVEGLITDSVGINYIKLSTAVPFDSTGTGTSQRYATVYISDNNHNVYYFDESTAGYYKPRDKNFKGIAGNTYILNVTTKDGSVYQSTPQTILSNFLPNKFYNETVQKDELFYDAYGVAEKVTKDWYSLKLDFKGTDEVTPRFRFVNKQCIQYLIVKELGFSSIYFYCWYTVKSSNTLNFTDEKYPVASLEIKDYPVEEFYKSSKIGVFDMDTQTLNYTDSLIDWYISYRILRINQYRMNEDAYRYYKGIADQSADEGKIFDPISAQLYGNMKCISDTSKIVLGFFETSSVTTYSFSVRGSDCNTKKISNIFSPTVNGFKVDTIPDFWIQ
jgi:hypothetical protein